MRINEEGLQSLREGFEKLAVIPDSEWNYFSSFLDRKTYNLDEFLFKAGEPVTYFYYIISGLVRYFYLTEAAKNLTKRLPWKTTWLAL